MGLFDFWKKKPTPPTEPTTPPIQEPKQEQKESQKKVSSQEIFTDSEGKSRVRSIERIDEPHKKPLSQTELYAKFRNDMENGSEYQKEGFFIDKFNKYFNPFRDIITRILSEKGIVYTNDLAYQLEDKIEESGQTEGYIWGVKDKKLYYLFSNQFGETVGEKNSQRNYVEDQQQTKLQAFEYDLIINDETNKHRVSEILEALNDLNVLVKENYPIYKLFKERIGLANPLDGLMESVLDHQMSIEDMAQYTEFIKLLNPILEFKIELVESRKFSHNTIYENLALFHHEDPYEIGHKVGYNKIYLSTELILFCYLKRDEILEVFYSRASQGVKVPDKAREAHTYIIGASKSGKSELIKDLIFSDFKKGNKSVILIEPHGDLAEQVARLKDKDNENLVYIDFTLDPTKTPILNPFDISDRTPENIEIQAQALIDAFEDILGAEFSTQMEELLGATIRTLMQTGKGDFWELRRFMDDENNSDLITAGKASPNPKDRLFFNDGSFNQTSYKPTKSSLKSKIGTYLGYAVFRNFTTGKTTIDLKKLTDGKKWVIFNLSKGSIGKKVSPILGRFVIASLQNIILQRAKTTHRTPVYLYIDEFQNYTSETIEEIFSESRKYGFHLTVAHQNTGQLLGKMRDLVFSNTSVKIVGRNDTDQLKKLSNQILVDFEELDKLTLGNFYMRVEKNQANPIKVGTKLIDNKYSMTAQEWEQVKAEQLKKYYEPIQEREPPKQEQTAEQGDNFNFNPSDTTV